MKYDRTVTVTSLLALLLVTLHLADDIVRGMAPGNLATFAALVFMAGFWLCGTLFSPGRRAGYVILLLASLAGLLVPIVHMKGGHVGGGAATTAGDFFFVWVLLALGASSGFLLVLSVRGLWGLRRAGTPEPAP